MIRQSSDNMLYMGQVLRFFKLLFMKSSADFFKLIFSTNYFRNTVSNGLDPDQERQKVVARKES